MMTSNRKTVVVGAFDDVAHAQQCVAELRRVGFREDQIGVAGRHTDVVEGSTAIDPDSDNMATGAATGAVAGAGVGALWALGIAAGVLPAIGPVVAGGILGSILASAAGAAAAGGLVGALIGLGIPEEEAKYFESEFHSGRMIVTVRTDDRFDEAQSILRRFGAHDMVSRPMGSMAEPTAVRSTGFSGVRSPNLTTPATSMPVTSGGCCGGTTPCETESPVKTDTGARTHVMSGP